MFMSRSGGSGGRSRRIVVCRQHKDDGSRRDEIKVLRVED